MNKDMAFFDNCADTWDSIRFTNPQILKQLLTLANIPAGSTVLDVGSGTGVLLPYLPCECAGGERSSDKLQR